MISESRKIKKYLENYGWSFVQSSPTCISSGWSSKAKDFTLSIEISEHFFSFETKILDFVSFDRNLLNDLMLLMMDLNNQAKIIRLSFSEKLELLIQADMLKSSFSYDNFEQMLGIFGYYSENIYEILLVRLLETNSGEFVC